MQPGIYRIRRAKLNGLGSHYGVVSVGVLRPGQVDVIDLDKKKGIRHYDSIKEWAHGRRWRLKDRVPDDRLFEAIERMREAIHRNEGYDLLSNNCEHFASWVVVGKRQSGQVTVGLLAAAGALLVGLFAGGGGNDSERE